MAASSPRRWPLRLFFLAVGLALTILALRAYVADVYRVDSGSMRPTIFGPIGDAKGESVLVVYGEASELERFDPVVILRSGAVRQEVKRLVGLPGEEIRLVGGDLFVDGRLLGADAPRPRLVPVFEAGLNRVEEAFYFLDSPDGPWRRSEEGWELDAADIEIGSDAGLMLLHQDLTDGWIDPSGDRVLGAVQVNDGAIEAEVRVEAAGGQLRLKLVEEGDSFQARIEPRDDGTASAVIQHWNADKLRESAAGDYPVIAETAMSFAHGQWHRLRFSNVDNVLRLEVGVEGRDDGWEELIEYGYPKNSPRPRPGGGPPSIGPRVAFGGAGVRATFRNMRVLRDFYWVPRGAFGADEAVSLGPAEYFVLGDDSAGSSDSRSFGPIRAAEIVGRPVAVVWPLARRRALEGALEGSARADESGSN